MHPLVPQKQQHASTWHPQEGPGKSIFSGILGAQGKSTFPFTFLRWGASSRICKKSLHFEPGIQKLKRELKTRVAGLAIA